MAKHDQLRPDGATPKERREVAEAEKEARRRQVTQDPAGFARDKKRADEEVAKHDRK
jgi:hypothetical protein